MLGFEAKRSRSAGVKLNAGFGGSDYHLFVCDVVFDDIPICAILPLFFGVEWDINRSKPNNRGG
jgi:hypothetical protein